MRKWSRKYKKSINCNRPKGFSQKQYCKGRKSRKNKLYNYNTMKNRIKTKRIIKKHFKYQKFNSKKSIKSRKNTTRKDKNFKGGSQIDDEIIVNYASGYDYVRKNNFNVKIKRYIPINCILKKLVTSHNQDPRSKISDQIIMPNIKKNIKLIIDKVNNFESYITVMKEILLFNRDYKRLRH
jgi:hypothetical protein